MPHKKIREAVTALKQPVTLKQVWPAWLLAFVLVGVTMYNLLSLMSFRAEIRRIQLESLPKAGEAPVVSASSSEMTLDGTSMALVSPLDTLENPGPQGEVLPQGQMSSFGDNFSGLGYIDEEKTDMYWDENVTAFSFPPVFTIEKRNDCSQAYCGLAPVYTATETVCLDIGCLNWTDNKLYYKGKTLKYPPDLPASDITDISIHGMGKFFLIGIVTGPKESEKGWVYRFDGMAYEPIITSTSEYRIEPRFERGGGKISFGGTPDDYLVLYSGYDGRAYRVRAGRIEDLSRFFGLRVTAGGFEGQIVKSKGIFYVCSLTDSKPKVIKIWMDKEGKAAGALDLSVPMAAKGWNPEAIRCSGHKDGGLDIAARQGGAWSLWRFIDQGFDNTKDRSVESQDLIRQKEINLEAAVVADLGLEADRGYELFQGNSQDHLMQSSPYVWQTFKEEGKGLFWRISFKADPEDAAYSPWLDHINRLDYLFTEKD